VFNEHTVHGPPDKIFEDAAFIEKFRNMLVVETGQDLWLARGVPRAWLQQGKQISVTSAPTRFGEVSYKIVSDIDNNRIRANVRMPERKKPDTVLLRIRHPYGEHIKAVSVNVSALTSFSADNETIDLRGFYGEIGLEIEY